jgi:hypothetical protein
MFSYRTDMNGYRGYDTPQLFRQDLLCRIRSLEREVQERIREIEEVEKGLPAEGNGI